MKKSYKFLSLTIASALALGVSGAAAIAETTGGGAAPETPAEAKIYLVPGSYIADGETAYNTVPTGATKLDAAGCDAVNTANAYLCTVAAGGELPAAATEREDYSFNGWWGIEDATVTYYDKVPDAKRDMFLYADFRAELSQRKDPIIPDGDGEREYAHYMEIKRAATGKTVRIPLYVSGTDVPNAVQAGYGGPVQFYNEWFLLTEGDEIKYYISNVYGKTPTLSPQNVVGTRKVTLEISGAGNPDRSTPQSIKMLVNGEIPDFAFPGDYSNPLYGEPTARCIRKGSNYFRIYIKFYDNGGTMTIYMERMASAD